MVYKFLQDNKGERSNFAKNPIVWSFTPRIPFEKAYLLAWRYLLAENKPVQTDPIKLSKPNFGNLALLYTYIIGKSISNFEVDPFKMIH